MVEGHPEPPDDLHERELELIEFDSTLWRIAGREYRESPLHFGSTGGNRFDAPNNSYGVCYLALAFRGAFLETLGRDLHINFVTPEALSSRVAATVCRARHHFCVDDTTALNGEAFVSTLEDAVNHYWFGFID